MSHVQPLARDSAASLAPLFDNAEQLMGFVPNSMLTMAHMPQLPVAFMLIANCVMGGDLKAGLAGMAALVPEPEEPGMGITPELIQLVAFAASIGAGCGYCQAHTSQRAHEIGVPDAKYADILRFETSDAYSPAERAAVALAFAAASVPNEATADHFTALREHFSERQIVQVVAVISLFGFLNRWNDTMATQLEASPVAFATQSLDGVDWQLGKHGA